MMKKILPVLLSLIFLSASIVYVAGSDKNDTESERSEPQSFDVPKRQEEMSGVWVTYMTLDVENESDKESAFKEKVDAVIGDMKSIDLNTMIVQVRPFCDALYPSRYFPWSHILTGTQGKDPGFDPLQYIIDAAHENNIMVHAWVNPYRISTKNTPSDLSSDHPYKKDNSIGVEVNGSLYLNPASDKTVQLIADGAKELAQDYEIDGIQFDDYFYPPDCGDFDASDYEAYCAQTDQPLSLDEFRKQNVSRMVKEVYQAIHKTGKKTVFGISPQGNLKNNEGLYADVITWCAEKGYIDYICPQIYFSLDNPALTFEDGLQDWLQMEKHQNLALYIGIPAYKAGTDADGGTWLDNDDILTTEIEITREKKTDGFMLYSYDSFHNEDNEAEIQNVIRYLTTSPTQ